MIMKKRGANDDDDVQEEDEAREETQIQNLGVCQQRQCVFRSLRH
jgi:hypothetical protein